MVMKSYLESEPIYSYIQNKSFSTNLASILMYSVVFALDNKMLACSLKQMFTILGQS